MKRPSYFEKIADGFLDADVPEGLKAQGGCRWDPLGQRVPLLCFTVCANENRRSIATLVPGLAEPETAQFRGMLGMKRGVGLSDASSASNATATMPARDITRAPRI